MWPAHWLTHFGGRLVKIEWRDGSQPFAVDFDDIYYAAEGGLDEARYVFLQQNNLEQRFRNASRSFVIAELGFGTALNFLTTLELWQRSRPAGGVLHYISCEKFPLHPDQIRRALSRWPELHPLADKFLRQYIELPLGFYRFRFEDERVALTLLIGNALQTLPELEAQVDAWYLDGFSPKKNPDLWSPEIFSQMARLSKPGTTLATYTAAGHVSRSLNEVGFVIEKFKGFGKKREMLKGVRTEVTPEAVSADTHKSSRAAIIGGGLAGASMAHALSLRGYKIDLIEKHRSLAQEASGNFAGINLPMLSAEPTLLSQLSFSGLLHLNSTFESLEPYSPTGLLHLAIEDDLLQKWDRAIRSANIPESFARLVAPEEASELSKVKIERQALHFAHAGLISAPNLTESLGKKSNARIHFETKIDDIRNENGIWRTFTEGRLISESEILILGNAIDAQCFTSTDELPLRPIRGQIAHIESAALADLKMPLCFDGYITPRLSNGLHLLGATFDRQNLESIVKESDNVELLKKLARGLPSLEQDAKVKFARVNFRTSCPGQEPIIGPISTAAEGLYTLTALAARGSLYAGIGAEFLASQITGEPLPLSRSVIRGLSPNRFLKANRKTSDVSR